MVLVLLVVYSKEKDDYNTMNWELFDKICGVQGVLAILMTIAVIGFLAFDKAVPGDVWGLMGIAWGFYFSKNGTKIASSIAASIKSRKDV